jgi:murein DD-endopeptidase MepM/ murein hydrolase activator NlpD
VTQHLPGFHDIGGEPLMADAPGWVTVTEAIGSDPNDHNGRDYRHLAPHGVLVRLNNGYGSTGTIPPPDRYGDFAQRAANFVAASKGCHRWIIGNEPNLKVERPDGIPISAAQYAQCFVLCREAIRSVQRDAQLLTAAIGPWNIESGDWLAYFEEVLGALLGSVEGIALHTYTHGADPALVNSNAKMDPPYDDRFYHFRAYRDFLSRVPAWARQLPVYITETDEDVPWLDQNNGWIQAAASEIHEWNQQAGTQKIMCLCCYRWSSDDRWAMNNKDGVLDDFQDAVALRYPSPASSTPPQPPSVPPSGQQPPASSQQPPRDIDPALVARGVQFEFARVPEGTGYWRITDAFWLDEDAADAVGPDHHILGTIEQDGREVAGIPLLVTWPGGDATIVSKRDDPNASYNYDFPMSASLNEFAITVHDGSPSDKVSGIGMGKDGNPGVHTSTWLDFAWTLAEQPEPGPEPEPPTPATKLVHPLPGAVITQHWGQNEENYRQFGLWGHNGTDLGGRPLRTPVRCIADGIVAMDGFDVAYGHYVRLDHRDLGCYSFYAHLDEPGAAAGTRLEAGDTVGLLGSSGNSSGPHLHLEVRLQNKDGTYREDTPMPKGRVDPETFCAMHNLKL